MSMISSQSALGYVAQASPRSDLPSAMKPDGDKELIRDFDADDRTRTPAAEARQTSGATTQTNSSASADRISRKTDLDWQTNELVYRVIDNRSGQVVSQSPDEALLRLRAYARNAETQQTNAPKPEDKKPTPDVAEPAIAATPAKTPITTAKRV